MASGVIYPAVGAAWAYLSVQSLTHWLAALLAIAIFALGFRFTYKYSKWLADVDWPKEEGKLEKMRESKGAIQTKPSGENP